MNNEWTIQDLMNNVEQGRQMRSQGCQINLENTYHELKQEGILERFKKFFTRRKDLMNVYYVIFQFNVISDTGHSYKVFIRTLADFNGSEFMKNKIQVYCGCQDFKYRSAWLLNRHDALFRTTKIDALLGPALTDSPSGKTRISGLCKHSMAAVNYFVSHYQQLMRSI